MDGKINKKHGPHSPSPVQPKYMEINNDYEFKKTKQQDFELSHCTFAPKTNEVKKDMTSAQLYLEVDPFERLSRSTKGNELSKTTRPSSAPNTFNISNNTQSQLNTNDSRCDNSIQIFTKNIIKE